MALLSERLKQLRNEKKLTQQELANKVGVNRVTYTNWENGKREPELDKVAELATELDCTVDYLLGLNDTNPFDILQYPEKIEKLSYDEIKALTKMLSENIVFISEIAKVRFNISDTEIKEILSTMIEEFKSK